MTTKLTRVVDRQFKQLFSKFNAYLALERFLVATSIYPYKNPNPNSLGR